MKLSQNTAQTLLSAHLGALGLTFSVSQLVEVLDLVGKSLSGLELIVDGTASSVVTGSGSASPSTVPLVSTVVSAPAASTAAPAAVVQPSQSPVAVVAPSVAPNQVASTVKIQ